MSQTSKKLYQKLQKQYSRRINLDLKRIKKVLEKLNNPEEQINNVINIIGSDGKNATLTSLKYFFEANNQKVNTFTSPHLYDVRQRFWLGNRFISLKEIKKYKKVIERTKQRLTLFELLTCVPFVFLERLTRPYAQSLNSEAFISLPPPSPAPVHEKSPERNLKIPYPDRLIDSSSASAHLI